MSRGTEKNVQTVSVALRPDTIDTIKRLAAAEHRTFSAYLRLLIEAHVPAGAK